MVSEIFGPTVQGEGPSTGRLAGFVRLGRCDLACSWCDTPYTWDWKGANGVVYDPKVELHQMDVGQVVSAVEAMGVDLVVLTGGEPLLQAGALTQLAIELHRRGHDIEVETNGRHRPTPGLTAAVTGFNVSPKLPNSGQHPSYTIRQPVLSAFVETGKARFKFVCVDSTDVDWVADLCTAVGIPASATWIMPEGRDQPAMVCHLHQVAEATIAHHFNITGRLHLELWGDKRGH